MAICFFSRLNLSKKQIKSPLEGRLTSDPSSQFSPVRKAAVAGRTEREMIIRRWSSGRETISESLRHLIRKVVSRKTICKKKKEDERSLRAAPFCHVEHYTAIKSPQREDQSSIITSVRWETVYTEQRTLFYILLVVWVTATFKTI